MEELLGGSNGGDQGRGRRHLRRSRRRHATRGRGASAAVQAIIARWHQHLRYCTGRRRGNSRRVGAGYNSDPAFQSTLPLVHPDLPAFMEVAITHYVAKLNV
ncbi:MAG: TipAS antibiotic-recognition domain-containing protein [Chloroflexi bacterium]|nr:TipAS antibiotic-recognition domain-containing protein [Chloroflexota bacterium]